MHIILWHKEKDGGWVTCREKVYFLKMTGSECVACSELLNKVKP